MTTAPPAIPIPPRTRSRSRIIRRVLFLALLAACAWFGWREYTFREAVREAEVLGIDFAYYDPMRSIQGDWTAAFRLATWSRPANRSLFLNSEQDVARVRQHASLARLRPKVLCIYKLPAYDCIGQLEDGGSVRIICFDNCTAKTLCKLAPFTALECIVFTACYDLENIDAVKQVRGLKNVVFYNSPLLSPDYIAALKAAMPNTKFCNGVLEFESAHPP